MLPNYRCSISIRSNIISCTATYLSRTSRNKIIKIYIIISIDRINIHKRISYNSWLCLITITHNKRIFSTIGKTINIPIKQHVT